MKSHTIMEDRVGGGLWLGSLRDIVWDRHLRSMSVLCRSSTHLYSRSVRLSFFDESRQFKVIAIVRCSLRVGDRKQDSRRSIFASVRFKSDYLGSRSSS